MVPDQDHEKGNRSGHNISSKSFQRCEGCDAHYYWCHMDDTQKYFFKCMVGNFQEKMAIPQKFVENFKGRISEAIKLEAPDGNIYNVQAIKDLNKIILGSGWAVFVSFYEVKEGYFLVFRYIGDSHFKVLIFDFENCCEKEVFHALMNCGPNAQEKDAHLDRSPLSERRCQNGGSSNGEPHPRCEHCDVHFYWHHMDDMQKHFLRLMFGNFHQEISIPEKFVKNFRGRISEVMKLEAPDGNIYNIKVTKDLNKIVLRSGWAAFATAYELKEYDLLVFRYIGASHFKVVIFDPSGCEKQLFHIVMNHAPNVQKRGISDDRSFLRETRRLDCESHDSNSRKTKKMTPLDSPSPRSAEGVTSPEDTMNSGGLWETTEARYVLAIGCNLTTGQKAEIDALVKKVRPVIPFYITAMNKTSMARSLVICKDYAAKYLPHEDQFITLCHPSKSSTWIDHLKVITDGSCMLSAGWSCFVLHNELRESDVCVFEVSQSTGEMTMVVHSLERGHHLQDEEPESQNKCNYPVKSKAIMEESDEEYAESKSNYYYSKYAKGLTGEEQEDIFRSVLIQQGNPVYIAVLQKNHVSRKPNLLFIPKEFAAKHLAARSHDIMLLRPNGKKKWRVWYYYHSTFRGFNGTPWTKFVCDNELREGYICVFELIKGVHKATMFVHVFTKVDGRLVLLD
ncbi:B3 domain-containing protein LOC_Os12g40080-like [Hordeum vulgare subsp. vulgare]|uniref:TF-B3 domain-containing protein n=1 Tax=Hordeum vulgare subsp. vulgare TaxID=112509 RepID=M0WRM3_HORVV|nr:B3 domain-containing protein LOC_Os12g40080-like [Hordeum vulgare subsp. vulgare]